MEGKYFRCRQGESLALWCQLSPCADVNLQSFCLLEKQTKDEFWKPAAFPRCPLWLRPFLVFCYRTLDKTSSPFVGLCGNRHSTLGSKSLFLGSPVGIVPLNPDPLTFIMESLPFHQCQGCSSQSVSAHFALQSQWSCKLLPPVKKVLGFVGAPA